MSSNASELNPSQKQSNSFELNSPQTSESSSIPDNTSIEAKYLDNSNIIDCYTTLGANILNYTCQRHGILFKSLIKADMHYAHYANANYSEPEPEVFDDSKFQTFVDLMENCGAVYQIPKNSDIGASLKEFIDNKCDVPTHMKNFNYIWVSQEIPEIKRNWDAHRDLFIALQREKEQFIIIKHEKHKYVARLDMCAKGDLCQPRRLTIGRKVYMVATNV